MYKRPNQKIIDRYLSIYENNSLQECLIGLQPECRIYNRDSYLSCITDPEVFLEYVIYPLFTDGDHTIYTALAKEVDALILSNNPVEFFQGINYLCGERILKKIHGELPFYLFDESRIDFMRSRLSDMRDKLTVYRDGDFKKYKETMYDMAVSILKY